jgi:hypothetical protein
MTQLGVSYSAQMGEIISQQEMQESLVQIYHK